MLTEKERINHIDKIINAKDSIALSKQMVKRVKQLKKNTWIWRTSNEESLPSRFIQLFERSGMMEIECFSSSGEALRKNVPVCQYVRKLRLKEHEELYYMECRRATFIGNPHKATFIGNPHKLKRS